jgi:PAS domain S-box-containing protein
VLPHENSGEGEEQPRSTASRLHDLEELVQSLDAIVWEADARTWVFSFVSRRAEDILGYPVQEWLASPTFWADHIHPDDRERSIHFCRLATDAGQDHDFEYRAIASDGREVWLRDVIRVVADEHGRPEKLRGLMLDITARKHAEAQLNEAETRFRTLVEQLPVSVFVSAPESGSIPIYISPYNETMLGYSAEEYLSEERFWITLVHPDDRERVVAEAKRTDETGEPFICEYRMITKDGREVWFREHTVLLRDDAGRPRFWQGAFFDITEQKRAAEELERALAMEREATAKLRTLDEMKNTFLEAVSHELRTPLTTILGTALTLEREEIELPPEEARDMLRRIADNARKLDRLLSDLLDLDRLSRGIVDPKRRPTDVSGLVARVVDETSTLSERTIHTEGDTVHGMVDAAMVERIVENLVVNAVRHTSPEAPIWVRVERQPDGVLLTVEDAGPGVPEPLREAVFEAFQQGQAPFHGPGTGIGLSLVARFAEMHKGRAWVEERDGGGASFKVFLGDT